MKIAIVGGGIAGLVAGWLAADAGHDVEVFEKDRLGAGASGKALGLLVPITGLDRPVDVLQRAGIAAWPELAARLSAVSGVGLEEFWREWEIEVRSEELGVRKAAQVRIPLIFEVLRLAIEAKGGMVHEATEVKAPARLREGFDRVVLAAGWDNSVLGGQELRVSAGLACRLRMPDDRKLEVGPRTADGYPDMGPLPHIDPSSFRGDAAPTLVAGDNLFVCPDWDAMVLAGSLNWDLRAPGDGVVPVEKLEELVARVGVLLPELKGAEVVDSWVGYRPTQGPRLPLLRDLGDGMIAVAGLGKTGIGLAPLLKVHE